MKAKKIWVVLSTLGFLAVSCTQSPIFHIIASETAPLKPRIEGAPTNMVVFNRKYPDKNDPVPVMYVASGQLHWYAKAQWDSGEYPIPQPDGKIISLAVTAGGSGIERLYALCRDGNNADTTLRYIESDGNEWKVIPYDGGDYKKIHSIYAGTSRLFIGASTDDVRTFAILYLGNDDEPKVLKNDSSLLSGAIYREDICYLSTIGKGIYSVSEQDLAANEINENTVKQLENKTSNDSNKDRIFVSMILLRDTIIAVERDKGAIYKVNDKDSFERMRYTIPGNNGQMETGRYTNGAIATWREKSDGGRRLLLVGIQGGLFSSTTTSHTYGYVEFDLKEDGSMDTGFTCRSPSISVHNNTDRYTATLGKHPVNHLFQVPKEIDENMPFFASTQTVGLWSYRDRPNIGGWQWNAEE